MRASFGRTIYPGASVPLGRVTCNIWLDDPSSQHHSQSLSTERFEAFFVDLCQEGACRAFMVFPSRTTTVGNYLKQIAVPRKFILCATWRRVMQIPPACYTIELWITSAPTFQACQPVLAIEDGPDLNHNELIIWLPGCEQVISDPRSFVMKGK